MKSDDLILFGALGVGAYLLLKDTPSDLVQAISNTAGEVIDNAGAAVGSAINQTETRVGGAVGGLDYATYLFTSGQTGYDLDEYRAGIYAALHNISIGQAARELGI